ncbi:MAG: RidA family protein [Clostridia bacterium]|nr:RidA family protein [Clostridia bacterium]
MKRIPEKYIKEPTGYPFAPVMEIEGKRIAVTSGTCCDDYDGNIPSGVKEQARNTILACEIFLKEAGYSLDDVFNVEVYMKDLSMWGEFNQVYKEMMPDPKPARKALETGLLPGYLVEIVMWACK